MLSVYKDHDGMIFLSIWLYKDYLGNARDELPEIPNHPGLDMKNNLSFCVHKSKNPKP